MLRPCMFLAPQAFGCASGGVREAAPQNERGVHLESICNEPEKIRRFLVGGGRDKGEGGRDYYQEGGSISNVHYLCVRRWLLTRRRLRRSKILWNSVIKLQRTPNRFCFSFSLLILLSAIAPLFSKTIELRTRRPEHGVRGCDRTTTHYHPQPPPPLSSLKTTHRHPPW